MRYCSVCYRETLHVAYVREKLMWDQCAGAHEILSTHEIDGIGAKEFFYCMEWRWMGAEDFFYR
jgi:hypothetical protein